MFKQLLPQYLEINNNGSFFGVRYGSLENDFQTRWAFWIRRLIQKNIITEMIDAIPREKIDTP